MKKLAKVFSERLSWCHANGRVGVGDFLDEVGSQVVGEFQMRTIGMTSEADRVAVEIDLQAKLTEGRLYHNKFHFLFELHEGLISKVSEYHDTRHAYEILESTLCKVGFI